MLKNINNILIKLKNNKHKIFIILLIILLISIIFYIYYKNKIEKFNNPTYKTLVSNWDNISGFYSELGFKLNHYLYCKKNNINFKTNSDNWSYKFKNGWTDYFQNIELKLNEDFDNNDPNLIHTESGCHNILDNFKIKDYIEAIKEYYKYTPEIQNIINNKKQELNIINGEYGSIYIRRGDKLVDEINFIHTDKFIDILLNIYPDCKTIFLQTDDYNCFIELKNYIKNKNLNINAITLCPETNFGAIANINYLNQMKENTHSNKDYLEKIKNNLSKPISDMTPEEKYNHTIELITSVDICINSKNCVCDYDSNVSRFIKLAHNNVMNVFDVNETDKIFDLESYKMISYKF